MKSLEELLLEGEIISAQQLAVAQRDAAISHKRLPQTLIDLGFVTDRRFAEWISGVTKYPMVDPLPADEAANLYEKIPANVAREYEIVPIGIDGNAITIAIVNPLDEALLGVVEIATNMDVKPAVAVYGSLKELLNRFYPPTDAPPDLRTVERVFDFGNETLISSHRKPLVIDEDASDPVTKPSPNQPATPQPKQPKQQKQLDRIEHQLGELVRSVADLQRRLDAIDSVLARVLTRDE